MTLEETFRALQGLTVGVTTDLDLAVKPKGRITPELRAALKEHKATIVCELLWDEFKGYYQEEIEQIERRNYPPPDAMTEAYLQGDPAAFDAALKEYDLVLQSWSKVQELLDSPDGGVVVVPGYGEIRIMPGDAGE